MHLVQEAAHGGNAGKCERRGSIGGPECDLAANWSSYPTAQRPAQTSRLSAHPSVGVMPAHENAASITQNGNGDAMPTKGNGEGSSENGKQCCHLHVGVQGVVAQRASLRVRAILESLPLLAQVSIEHQDILQELRRMKPWLQFPQLFVEMFQVKDD